MNEPARILVVDDDANIQSLVCDYLKDQEFVVASAKNATDAYRQIDEFQPNLVLLDIGLPDESGLAVAAKIRTLTEDRAIIMLTARSDVVDRVVGLESGADDYITKPFHLRELLARVRSVLRRKTTNSGKKDNSGTITFNGWRLDLGARELIRDDDEIVNITSKEFELLKLLATNGGNTVTRADIASHFGEKDWNPLGRSVDVLIFQLRSKIEDNPRSPSIIKTVRGAGYVFTASVKRESPLEQNA